MPQDKEQEAIQKTLFKGLTKSRGSMKQRVTIFQTYLDGLISDSQQENFVINEAIVIELDQRIQVVKNLLSDFESLQTKIEIDAPDDELETQYNYRQEFESNFYKQTSKAQSLLNSLKSQLATNNPSLEVTNGGASTSGTGEPSMINLDPVSYIGGVKLPTIEIPNFYGNYEAWLEFRDTFDSLIHQHPALKNIHKFHYLRSSLKGEAQQVIKSLDFSNSNYEKAWNLVCSRYNNTRLLINNHIKALFNIEKITNESSIKLRAFTDNLDKHLCALESLDQPTKEWDTLIIHMASLKLDAESNRKWEEHQTGTAPPTLQQFKDFINKRADFLESLELKRDTKGVNQSSNYRQTNKPVSRSLLTSNNNYHSRSEKCALCQNTDHLVYNCPEFQGLAIKDRIDKVKSLRLCLNCLRPGHFLAKCSSKSMCRQCGAKHNTLLHHQTKEERTDNPATKNVTLTASTNQSVLLGTVKIIVYDKVNKPHYVRAVLDCGSQSSYITHSLFKQLKIDSIPIKLTTVGLGLNCSNISEKCTVKIQSQHNAFNTNVSCLIIPQITSPLPETNFDYSSLIIPKHIRLADPTFNCTQEIEMLIGADCFWSLLCAAQIKLGQGQPILQKTKLGWLVSGPIQVTNNISRTHCNFSRETNLQLERFWEVEENLSNAKVLSQDERACEIHFQNTTLRNEDGQFVVSIPLKEDLSLLGESKQRALRLFHSLERRLQNNELLRKRYTEFMTEYLELGHMSPSKNDETSNATYFMPHHGVIREQSETTKLRVVFNGSAPSSSGYSFNDLQFVGPTIQEDLFAILLRFRQHTYVVSADISKMYRQILVKEDQRPLQKILWRSDPSHPLGVFNLNTVTYGTASAPFLAIRCLFQLADEFQSRFPVATEVIKRDFYVDDMLTGADSIEELQAICRDVNAVLESGSFHLRKWISNDTRVLQGTIDESKWSEHCTNFIENDHAKTLGVGWSSRTDCLLYKIDVNGKNRITKRSILSDIARIFDPLGLLAPVIITAKMILQFLWQSQTSWDESIPLDLNTRWSRFRSELLKLNDLTIERNVILPNSVQVELHGFSDASERAYGACIYLRSLGENGQILVRLLCAKSKVSPLKSMTMPRLELCGALILSRLFSKVIKSLRSKLNTCTFWTDSTIVLGWINTEPSKLKPFVSNRIAEIQSLTQPHLWRHVSTNDNPADLVSRGVDPETFKCSKLWWSGPPWLSDSQLPVNNSTCFNQSDLPELKSKEHCLITSRKPDAGFPFDRFSSFVKMQRVTAYCLRFRQNVVNCGALLFSETATATIRLILLVQKEAFSEEIAILRSGGVIGRKSKLFSLSAFLHTDGTLRVGGRLRNTNYSFDKIHPILLPSYHKFTLLLFEYEHRRLLHCGPQLLLSSIREFYWPIGGRNLARKIVRQCVICAKVNPKPFCPPMGNLPESRSIPAPPFYKTGVDYAGPLLIASKRGRGSKLSKCYVCLFICLSTKCVHLELVSDLSTEAFLMTIRRFAARRGKPLEIWSDNGTNFIGANNELRELANMLKDQTDSLPELLSREGLNWKFIPPRSPHFGGIWEAGVRSVKQHLRKVAGNAHLTFEELTTLLTQIESVLNSRPLCPLSPDPNDLTPLTPGHFLIGRSLASLPDCNLLDVQENRLSRYQRVQQLIQHFWVRWKKDYLAELQRRSKWAGPQPNVKEGALVVLVEDNVPPLKWRMGRVSEVFPGADGCVRVAAVKTASGAFKRSVTKLCPLPISADGCAL